MAQTQTTSKKEPASKPIQTRNDRRKKTSTSATLRAKKSTPKLAEKVRSHNMTLPPTRHAPNWVMTRPEPPTDLKHIKWHTARFSKLELVGAMAIAGLSIALLETFVWLGSALAKV